MRSLCRTLAVLAMVLGSALPARAAGLSVRYRSATSVYVDGGRAQGLSVGDRLLVQSGRETIAELEVEFAAEQSASCRLINERRTVRAGDAVVPKPRTGPPPPVVEAQTPQSAPSPAPAAVPPDVTGVSMAGVASTQDRPRPFARLRGGASVGYYQVDDRTPSAFDFQQSTARLDLIASDIAGRPLSFTARMRSRHDVRARTLGSLSPKDQRDDRVYELALRYEPASQAFGLEAGRIGISRFVGLGYLDGLLGRVRVASGLHLGAFGGRRGDPDTLQARAGGAKYGAFLQLAPGGRWARSYEVVLAGVREMGGADVDREYLSVESRFGSGSGFRLYERAELDWNRGWRLAASNGRPFQLSNLSVGANLRLSPSASASFSYDSRRNYRTQLNRSVPENVFDDLTRQGLRGGLYLGRGDGLSGSLSGGVRFDPQGGRATYSSSASLRHGKLFGSRYQAGLDGSSYWSAFGNGLMLSGRVGRRFQAGHDLQLSYTRSRYNVAQGGGLRSTQWLRFSGRGELGHGLYLVGDLEYDRGDDLKGPRVFGELGYQF